MEKVSNGDQVLRTAYVSPCRIEGSFENRLELEWRPDLKSSLEEIGQDEGEVLGFFVQKYIFREEVGLQPVWQNEKRPRIFLQPDMMIRPKTFISFGDECQIEFMSAGKVVTWAEMLEKVEVSDSEWEMFERQGECKRAQKMQNLRQVYMQVVACDLADTALRPGWRRTNTMLPFFPGAEVTMLYSVATGKAVVSKVELKFSTLELEF